MKASRCSAVLALIWGWCVPYATHAAPAPPPTTPLVIDKWNTELGLPQNVVTSILQSREGYLWLGTLGGLVRFDGIRFTVFDTSNTPGLASGRILSLFEDSRQQLWLGTANSGVFVVRESGVTPLPLHGNGTARLASICEDPGGAVWLQLSDGALWRSKDGMTQSFSVQPGQASDYRGIVAEANGPLWVATDQFLAAIDWQKAANSPTLPMIQTVSPGSLNYLLPSHSGGVWRFVNGRIEKWSAGKTQPDLVWGWYPWWGSARLSTACEDSDGQLVVGTLGAGLYRFDRKGEATRISTDQGLSSDYVLALHVDREGDLWVGTDGGGLNRIRRPLFEVLEPSRGYVVQSVAADQDGGLWVGCNTFPVFYWKDGRLTRPSPQLPARSVLVDAQQRIWVGRPPSIGTGLEQFEDHRFRPVPGFDPKLQFVTALHQDRRGWLWVGTKSGLARWDGQTWQTFTTSNGLSSDAIQAIADDAEGRVWIGTEGGGLNCWRESGFAPVFRGGQDGLPSDYVSSLHADKQGVLWIGTDGGGLARFHAGKWARYTRNEGLISNSIGYLIEDDQGSLWIGSYAGLMRVAKAALNDVALGKTNSVFCRVYGKSDGLPIRECSSGSQPGPGRTPDGKLWFPTIQGLASVQPAKLKPNTNPPPVKIEAVLVDGRAQFRNTLGGGELKTIQVPPANKHLEIQYSSLNLSAPERALFKYRLREQDGWTEAGNTRVVHYNQLPPGDYHFQVIASNEDGVWSQTGATLHFVITPPFWRTWWFMSSAAVCLLAGVTGLVHYFSTQRLQRQVLRLRQQEALEKERTRIARDIHDQVGASLTQVALLGELVESDKEEPTEVEAHARQISLTARETTRVLDEIVWAVNPANDTLDGLVTYICKYTQEYLTVAGLHYRLDVPSPLPASPLPPEVRHNVFLACKEAVTNVVRHAHATAVWVRLRLLPAAFELEIEDNGRGLGNLDQKAAEARNGLRNMRHRMEEIGGEFGFAPARDGGTLVRFRVPIAAR